MARKGRIQVKLQKGKSGTKIARFPIVVNRVAQTPRQATKLLETRARLLLQIYIDQNGEPRPK